MEVIIINTPPVMRLLRTIHPPIMLSRPTVKINMPITIPSPPYIEPMTYESRPPPIKAPIAAMKAKMKSIMPAISPSTTAETLPDFLVIITNPPSNNIYYVIILLLLPRIVNQIKAFGDKPSTQFGAK